MLTLKDILKILETCTQWKELVALPGKVATLENRVAELEAQLHPIASSEFVESHGALFKRNPDGSFQEAVYCPRCKTSTVSIGFPQFDCSCGWVSSFTQSDLPKILRELDGA